MATNGWFWIYTNQIPAAHPISWDMVGRDFWNLYIFPSYPWLIMVIVLAVISLWIMRDKVSVAQAMVHHSIFALTFFLPLSLMSIVSMAKQWGYINGLLPMVAALSVIGMEAYQRVVIALTSSQNKTWIFTALYALASVCLLFQFIALRYDFRTQIPSKASLEQGYRILSILKDSKQPVFIPTSPYLLYMVDQPTHFQVSSLSDLSLAGQYDPAIKELSKGYQEKISEYLMSKSIQTILLPNTNWYDKTFSVENGYDCESLVSDHSPLVTVTGAKSYLDRICRLRIASTQAQNR